MKLLFFLFIFTGTTSCRSVMRQDKETQNVNKLEQLSWLLGKWQMQTPEGTITEVWSQPSDSQWKGLSFIVSGQGDTPFRESIILTYQDDQLIYSPTVSNQNGGKRVSFTEKSFSANLVIFENLNHDFPQRIIYKRISDTSILAAIEGVQNGQNRREEFAYTKK